MQAGTEEVVCGMAPVEIGLGAWPFLPHFSRSVPVLPEDVDAEHSLCNILVLQGWSQENGRGAGRSTERTPRNTRERS